MIDTFRFVGEKLFGWRWVVVTTPNNTKFIRRVKYVGKWASVDHGRNMAVMLNNGDFAPPEEDSHWEYYTLFAKPEWPKEKT